MPETQPDVDELVTEFDTVREDERIHITTDGGSFDCEVSKASKTDERAELFLRRPEDGAQIHVWTQRSRGWLDPLVDVIPTEASRGREPVGTLINLRRRPAVDSR